MSVNRTRTPHLLLSAKKPVLPVVVVDAVNDAVSVASALFAGGVTLIELTLRTPAALQCIEAIRARVPEITVGAGTVLNPEQMRNAASAGAQFMLSPGTSADLLSTANDLDVCYTPGAFTASDIQTALSFGISYLKLFPACTLGHEYLQQLKGPFPEVQFCPTGGITEINYKQYLQEDNVFMVGGSWLAPASTIKAKAWHEITARATNLKHALGVSE